MKLSSVYYMGILSSIILEVSKYSIFGKLFNDVWNNLIPFFLMRQGLST